LSSVEGSSLVVGQVEALGLQLGDGGLELRDGGRDVGQLDDVGLGRLVASSPSSARASAVRWSSGSLSAKAARMRPANEMSRVSTSTPAVEVKASTIGRNE
jgi:hypothetical protein